MPGRVSKDEAKILTLSLATVLGVKGPIRFSSHGSTQKPHVILRRVLVSESEGDDGHSAPVVRFSLFAAKRIEVKPGKEILMSVESDEFNNRPIVIEADEGGSNEEEVVPLPPPRKEPTPAAIAMPPKMRKGWLRPKIEDPPAIELLSPRIPSRSEIGIQAKPTYTSLPVQAQPPQKIIASPNEPSIISIPVDTPHTQLPKLLAVNGKSLTASSTEQSITTKAPSLEIEERSASPMELESPVQTPEFSPTLVPEMIDHLILSPSPAPSLGISATFKDFKLPINRIPQTPSKPARQFVKQEPVEETISWTSPSVITKPAGNNPQPSAAKLVKARTMYKNPFKSTGYVTDFIGLDAYSKANRQPDSAATTVTKQAVVPPVASTSKAPSPPRPAPPATKVNPPPPPPSSAPTTSSPRKSRFGQPTKPIRVKEEEVDLSLSIGFDPVEPTPARNVIYERLAYAKVVVVPKGPRAMLAVVNKDARPGSPVTSHSRSGTPPPAAKEIAYINTGPSSNPLSIHPSVPRRVAKAAPVPDALIPSAVTKKRVVIGPKWGQKQANGTVSATTHPALALAPAPPPGAELKPVVVKTEPLPPEPLAPPAPLPTPKSKWKRIAGERTPSTVTVKMSGSIDSSTLSTLDAPAAKHTSLVPLKPAQVPLTAKTVPATGAYPQGPVTQSSPNANPTYQQPSVQQPEPVQTFTAEQALRESGTFSTPLKSAKKKKKKTKSQANTTRPVDSSVSTPVHAPPQPLPVVRATRPQYSPNPSTPSNSTPTTATAPSLSYPLPPKPITNNQDSTRRAVKREREASPELFTRRQRRRRDFPWPTIRSSYVSVLAGLGNTAVRKILFSNNGNSFACLCADETIRIWSTKQRIELVRINLGVPVVAMSWMEDDGVLLCLDEDGLLGRWIRRGPLHSGNWNWTKVFHAGRERPSGDGQVCLAYMRGRIAVSYPKDGVSVWVWQKGHWSKQRSILRQNVTALKFIEDGVALIGGTQDGVLWRSDVPNGTLRAYAFLKTRITSLDMSPNGSQVLVAQVGGTARLVSMRRSDHQGMVEKSYTYKATETRTSTGLGAFHVNTGDKVLFGSTEGCVMVWDHKNADTVCGLEHDEGDIIEAIAVFEGQNREGYIVTGTKSGCLAWYPQPLPKGAFDR